ncbi:heterokaryon incompatibility protein-domain-containing protein [Scleroderma yunnanense]
MYLINVNAVLVREDLIRKGKEVDCRTEVIEVCDDEAKDYAILSHRWIGKEVKYEEMVELATMNSQKRDEIRHRDGYKKILKSCAQAKKDGYKWLWVDTCCIDKRSSAELSEAINSMYQWYENSRVCYAYLHDVLGSSLPTAGDEGMYPNSNGYPEWFSRGWTLQEMIAPSDLRFFNKAWQPIGDKRTLAPTLTGITGVPQHILTDGLSGNRPCVAQIMSWAADRRTTRVEDRAYSLMGLLDVNMPMLYGEGKKAFQRLQMEIIRVSNDHSIFAWRCHGEDGWTGSILADDPSLFRSCSTMELLDHNEYIQSLKRYFPEEDLRSIEEDKFDVFPITNRGIQIWLLLSPRDDSSTVFDAWLPCRLGPSKPPIVIILALRKSNYYRCKLSLMESPRRPLPFRQLYLRYQDTLHRGTTFEIDDGSVTKNGLTYCGTYPSKFTRNTFTLNTNQLCVKVYSDEQAGCRFAVGIGQSFGQDWIHVAFEEHANGHSWEKYAKEEHNNMLAKGREHGRSMFEARGEHDRRVCVKHTSLPGSRWTVRTSCVVWKGLRNRGVKIDAFRYPSFSKISSKWTGIDVEGTDDPNYDMRSLMIHHSPSEGGQYELLVDGLSVRFSPSPKGIRLGDYGYFADTGGFRCEGNIFALSSEADITPRQQKISTKDGYDPDSDYVTAWLGEYGFSKPVGLSLPRNPQFNSWLVSFSTRLADRYLVTRVIQCVTKQASESPTQNRRESILAADIPGIATPLCTIAKPFVWHRGISMSMKGNSTI